MKARELVRDKERDIYNYIDIWKIRNKYISDQKERRRVCIRTKERKKEGRKVKWNERKFSRYMIDESESNHSSNVNCNYNQQLRCN